jgi:hypothetical protein
MGASATRCCLIGKAFWARDSAVCPDFVGEQLILGYCFAQLCNPLLKPAPGSLHKERGESIVIWRDGKIVTLEPEEIGV